MSTEVWAKHPGCALISCTNFTSLCILVSFPQLLILWMLLPSLILEYPLTEFLLSCLWNSIWIFPFFFSSSDPDPLLLDLKQRHTAPSPTPHSLLSASQPESPFKESTRLLILYVKIFQCLPIALKIVYKCFTEQLATSLSNFLALLYASVLWR